MLEICCGSYYDAMQAASGGAGRIELNCALHLGGLTPSLASLELVKEHCNVKVIAMVRPRGGGFCYSEEDFNVMLRECEHLVRHGADGIAFGCLREDASIDRERNARMISIIHSHGKEAVFHRAFDCTSNPYESIETLIELGAGPSFDQRTEAKGRRGKGSAWRPSVVLWKQHRNPGRKRDQCLQCQNAHGRDRNKAGSQLLQGLDDRPHHHFPWGDLRLCRAAP